MNLAATVGQVRLESLLEERPRWRGVFHTWAFVAAIPAGAVLIAHATGAVEVASAAIYVASVLAVFGVSASYHRLTKTFRARQIMQRLDHGMIFVLIAGTYTPICLVGLPRGWGISLLSVVGALGLLGMAIKFFHLQRLQWLGYSLYLVIGWAAVVAMPVLVRHLTPVQVGLIIGGGVAYTVGFPILMLQKPDPWPRTFGYHEIWHGFTVVAAGLHFAAISLIIA